MGFFLSGLDAYMHGEYWITKSKLGERGLGLVSVIVLSVFFVVSWERDVGNE